MDCDFDSMKCNYDDSLKSEYNYCAICGVYIKKVDVPFHDIFNMYHRRILNQNKIIEIYEIKIKKTKEFIEKLKDIVNKIV